MRVAYVVVSTWQNPSCIQDRFSSLPSPTFLFTPGRNVTPVAPFSHILSAPRGAEKWKAMYGKTSGNAKKQFVRWLSGSNFTHAWHIEDDAVARDWNKTLFLPGDLPDLAAKLEYDPSNFYYRRYSAEAGSEHVSAWPVLLMSRKLARFISLHSNRVGHHEVMTHDMCLKMGGSVLNLSFPGVVLAAKWRKIDVRAVQELPFPHHPFKCNPRN